MRIAELIMALVFGVLSMYLMWKSAELPVGWIPEEGPGGGAFPFWLSAGMLLCTAWIVVRWWRRSSPPAQSDEPYMSRESLVLFLIGAGALTAMVGSVHFIGVYFATPLFLLFYMRVLGRHNWPLTALMAAGTPVVTFFFFEIALKITLPKGYTEPLFYPLYDIFL
jgi:hypothetical protein